MTRTFRSPFSYITLLGAAFVLQSCGASPMDQIAGTYKENFTGYKMTLNQDGTGLLTVNNIYNTINIRFRMENNEILIQELVPGVHKAAGTLSPTPDGTTKIKDVMTLAKKNDHELCLINLKQITSICYAKQQ